MTSLSLTLSRWSNSSTVTSSRQRSVNLYGKQHPKGKKGCPQTVAGMQILLANVSGIVAATCLENQLIVLSDYTEDDIDPRRADR